MSTDIGTEVSDIGYGPLHFQSVSELSLTLTSSNYQLFGDVKLNGSSKAGTTVKISYGGGQQSTTVGKFRLEDKKVNSEIVDGYVRFYFDMPAGSYTITASSGNKTASANVTTSSSTQIEDLQYGIFHIQLLSSELSLSAQGGGSTGDNPPGNTTPDQGQRPTTTPDTQQPGSTETETGVKLDANAQEVKQGKVGDKDTTSVSLKPEELSKAFESLRDKSTDAPEECR